MIKIGKPRIIKCKSSKIRLEADISEGNMSKQTLWFEVDEEYGDYLVDDRADAFVVIYLNYAMFHGHDIVCDAPVSSRLYCQLSEYFIPGLSNSNNRFKRIYIRCSTTDVLLENHGAIGTGMSGGVDSLNTIQMLSQENISEKYRINYLTFFNVGATQSSLSREYSYDKIIEFKDEMMIKKAEELNYRRIKRAKTFADEQGYPLIVVNSNVMSVQKIKFKSVHTQRNCATVLALQKLFSVYYYASGLRLNDFHINNEDTAYYDSFTLNMLSTDSVTFYSSGSPYSRLQKTKLLTKYEPSYRYLNVCWREDANCGICPKCVRTQVTLDFLGELNNYSRVFDLKKYEENRSYNIAQILFNSKSNVMFKEIKEYGEQNGVKYNRMVVAVHIIMFSLVKLLRPLVPKKIKILLKRKFKRGNN